MFPGSFWPASFWPASFWPKFGSDEALELDGVILARGRLVTTLGAAAPLPPLATKRGRFDTTGQARAVLRQAPQGGQA